MSLPSEQAWSPRAARALVIMARAPRAGSCKTRLCPPLSPQEACQLYQAFLIDIGRETGSMKTHCDLWVAWAAEDEAELAGLQECFPPNFRFLRQEGDSLTRRMEQVFHRLIEGGYRQVVMRNSDSPHLPCRLLDQAFDALDRTAPGAVVLGPDLDGGYYLVGLDHPPDELFPGKMSTDQVLVETRRAALVRGLAVTELEPFLDVDTPDDLRLFWLEFGGRADVRDWATWTTLNEGTLLERLEQMT